MKYNLIYLKNFISFCKLLNKRVGRLLILQKLDQVSFNHLIHWPANKLLTYIESYEYYKQLKFLLFWSRINILIGSGDTIDTCRIDFR